FRRVLFRSPRATRPKPKASNGCSFRRERCFPRTDRELTPSSPSHGVPPRQITEYVTVARVRDVPPGSVVQVQAGDRWYALANLDGVLHAVDNNCPHN